MSAKPVQISIDEDLLHRVDSRPEVQRRGRSAFVREALELYLKAKERREIDEQLVRAFEGEADAMLAEIEDLIGAQAWPND